MISRQALAEILESIDLQRGTKFEVATQIIDAVNRRCRDGELVGPLQVLAALHKIGEKVECGGSAVLVTSGRLQGWANIIISDGNIAEQVVKYAEGL